MAAATSIEPQADGSAPAGGARAADWLELTKPRIAVFVLLAAFVGAWLAPGADGLTALVAALAIGAVAAGSSALNHVLERELDKRMERTRRRPLPTGRLSTGAALAFGLGLGVLGCAVLFGRFGPGSAALAAATFATYAFVYTPLKRRTTLNTLVGAVPGAMPPLLGHLAAAEGLGLGLFAGTWGWTLFLVLFAWQFPHFLAIAYLYREDYARAGMRMLPGEPGGTPIAGRHALLQSLVVLPVSLLPTVRGEAGPLYALVAVVVGALYVLASLGFALDADRGPARRLLLVSLGYLPLLFAAAVADRLLLA